MTPLPSFQAPVILSFIGVGEIPKTAKDVGLSDTPAQETTQTPAQPARRELHRGVLTALLLIVPPIILVAALGFAISRLPPTPPDPNKPSPPPPPDETLLTAIRHKHEEVAARFAELETAHRDLNDAFKEAFGVTLEASANKKNLPRDLVDCMAAPNAPLRAWADLQGACVTESQFDEKRSVLRTVESKTRALSVTLTDRHDLEDLLSWTTKKLAASRGQVENINLIREWLRAYRMKETP